MLSFYEWVHNGAYLTDDPAGDLVSDLRRDSDLSSVKLLHPGHLESYLRNKHACSEALQAVPVVWKRYFRYTQRQHPRRVLYEQTIFTD